jgi:ribosomal protein S18 acetylase RimI-like enzyme
MTTITATEPHHYRFDLSQPFEASTTIFPYDLRAARSSKEMAAIHTLLTSVHVAHGRRMPARGEWWEALLADPEFDPGLVFLVATPNGILAAACMASRAGRVRELVVAPAFRRLRLGTALLGHVCKVFEEQGGHAVDLQVEAGNHAAIALCEAAGMRRAERLAHDRARYRLGAAARSASYRLMLAPLPSSLRSSR